MGSSIDKYPVSYTAQTVQQNLYPSFPKEEGEKNDKHGKMTVAGKH
jgi:hypothetical protein